MSVVESTGGAAPASAASSPSSSTGDGGERRIKRRKLDPRAVAASAPSVSQSLVSQHYNSISRADHRLRGSSSIIGLRSFNNWVKSVLISSHCPPHAAVLDLCSGKGGDLRKFQQANIAQYVGADAAAGSVREAVDRYNSGGYAFPALFLAADCHRALLSQVLPPALWFDLVSCQFALHYSFETEQTARDFLWNAAERLLPDGHLIATFPDAACLVSALESLPESERCRGCARPLLTPACAPLLCYAAAVNGCARLTVIHSATASSTSASSTSAETPHQAALPCSALPSTHARCWLLLAVAVGGQSGLIVAAASRGEE